MQIIKLLHPLHIHTNCSKIRNVGCNIMTKRRCSSNKSRTKESLLQYSVEQQKYIVDILQKDVLNNERRLFLNEKRLQSLRSLFEHNSDIQSLEPLLNANGIGPKLLHRICDNILQSEPHNESVQTEGVAQTGLKDKLMPHNSLITPPYFHQNSVESIISIHLGINAISWTRMWTSGTSENKVDNWDTLDLSEILDRKFDVHSIWDLILGLRDIVPDGDIYVMENTNWSNVANIKKSIKYHIQEAMLTTAVCSIFNQTDSQLKPRNETKNRLYFIRNFTPARLFNKIIGSERVSAQDIVMNMMEGIPDPRHRPITFSGDTPNTYFAFNGSLRDHMCRALLLAVSFAELIIHCNPEAISVIGKSIAAKKKKSS